MPDMDDLAIVLTGTIVPNAPFTAYNDPAVRRLEYLRAINFYCRYAKVFFLENSGYALHDDDEFSKLTNVILCRMPVSSCPERGKGYQEFEMLDNWVARESPIPERWMKITGRYIYQNINALLDNCISNTSVHMVVDQCFRSKKARTSHFYVSTEFYLKTISGIFKECDDASGKWIEYVLFDRLKDIPLGLVSCFIDEPDLRAISGSTGGNLEASPRKMLFKRILRKINRLFDSRYLWYTK